MNQSDLIKLAEIAGVENDPAWKPHKDLNKAFMCLEGLDKPYLIDKIGDSTHEVIAYQVVVNPEVVDGEFMYLANNLCIAICKVVLEAKK